MVTRLGGSALLLAASLLFMPSPARAASGPDTWQDNGSANLADPNWTGANNPTVSGDSWIFGTAGGSGAVLNNNLASTFSVAGIWFTNGASAFTLTNTPLTLAGNITNSSTSLETINLSITNTAARTLSLTAGGGNLTLGGIWRGTGGGITTAGAGILTITGTNAMTGPNVVSAGTTLNIPGSLQPSPPGSANTMTIANGAGNAVVNFSGSFLTNYNFNIGTVSGAAGALYQTAGVLGESQGANGAAFQIGNASGAYGYYYIGAGASFYCGEMGIGGEATPSGNAIMEVNGGNVTDTGYVVMSRGTSGTQSSAFNIYSGSLRFGASANNPFSVNWGTAGTTVINVMGGVISNSTANNQPITLSEANNAGNTGILNLNGGLVQVGYVNTAGANPNTRFNFNGGTLAANENQGVMMAGLTSASVYTNGGTFNNNGYLVTISQPLLAPTGNGVTSISLTSGGAGYIAPPIVAVVRGTGDTTGVGATAIAQIDTSTGGPTSGQVTNVLITNPGANYTATPTFTVSGGGPTTPATITGGAPTPNASGGMTFIGSGVTTLAGAGSYTNTTIINGGTLIFSVTQTNTSPIVVTNGTLSVLVPLNNNRSFTVNNGGTIQIRSAQTNTAPITVGDGGILSVAASLLPGSLNWGTSVGGTLAVAPTSTSQAPLVAGTLNLTGNNTLRVYGNLLAGSTYPIFSYTALTGTGGYTLALPVGVTGNLITNVTSVTTVSLAVTAVNNNVWTGAVNGTWDINTTANWLTNGVAAVYLDGSLVQFDDTGLNTATITNVTGAVVTPGNIFVNNNTLNYGLKEVIAGPGGIVKTGSANLTNSAANIYSGPTVINGGQLVAGIASTANVSGALGVNSAVTLANNAGAALNLNGFGTQIGSLTGGGTTGGNVILGSATLTVGGDYTSPSPFAGNISGTGGLTKIGPGTLTLTGTNTFTGAIGGITGTLTIGGAGNLGGTAAANVYPGTISDSGIFNYNSSGIETNTAVISGGGALVVNGSGTLTLSAANTYSGGTTVNNGNLVLTVGGSTGTIRNSLTINSGGTVTATAQDAIGYGTVATPVILNGGTFNDVSGANESYISQWLVTGGNVYGPTTGGSGLNFNTGYGITTFATNIVANFAINIVLRGSPIGITNALGTVPGGIDMQVSAPIMGSGDTLAKYGPGTLALSGVNTFTGGLSINAGTLLLNGAGQLNSGTFAPSILDNGAFVYGSTAAQTLPGAITGTGSVTMNGAGATLTLSGTNTYTGSTIVGAGTLTLTGLGSISNTPSITVSNGAIFDVSTLTTTPFTLGASQSLLGSGVNNGSISTTAGSKIYAGTDGGYGTNTFNNALTLVSGATLNFDLGTSVTTGPNDQIIVSGGLTVNNNNTLSIKAPNTSANLDVNNDYVLVQASGGLTGTFSSSPFWVVRPANANHFFVTNDTTANQVRLHYISVAAPSIASVSTSPSTVVRNQSMFISVTVTPGTANISTVTFDLTPYGGSLVSLVQSGVSSVWTNTVTVPPATPVGSDTVTVTVTDVTPLSGLAYYSLNVAATTETWNGAGGNANWDTNPNWVSTLAPGYVGDSLVFAGTVNTSPDVDQNYTVAAITFSNNAASFNIGSVESDTLTLAGGGVTNNSANPQTFNAAVALSGTPTFNAAAGNITVNSAVTGTGGLTKTGNGTLIFTNNNSYTGVSSIQGGTLAVANGTNGTVNDNIEIAAYPGEVASLNVTNGTVNADRVVISGISANNTSSGTATVNQSGGTINSREWFTVGSGNANSNSTATGTFNMSGGVLNVESQQMEVGNFIGASGTVNESSSSAINIWNGNYIALGANPNATNGTFNQYGGTNTFYSDGGVTPGGNGILYLGKTSPSAGIFTYNLDGGVLTVPQISHVAGTGNFYFNGGTLQAAKANSVFLTGLSAAYVSTNGANINDGGFSPVGVNQGLLHDPALGANADAGLTKTGSGTVTLGGHSTYTGNTTINGGTLQLSSDPVLFMTFDSVSGSGAGATVYNQGSGGSTMNGTISGNATIVPGGRFGNALNIPASSDSTASSVVINSPVVNFNNAGTWTWGIWVQTTTPGGTYMYQGNNTTWASGYTTFYLNNGGGTGTSTKAGGVRYSQGWEEGTKTITDGQWHFIAMTCNNGTKTLYVDGAVDALAANAWSSTGIGNTLLIGGNGPGEGDGQVGLGGLIDQVSIYNRTLSAAEILALYNNSPSQVLPTNTTVNIASGTFDVGGISQQISTLTGSGNVLLDDATGIPGTLTLGNASNIEYDQVISDTSGAGSLVKVGSGTLNLGGANTYGGTTTVSNGVLYIPGIDWDNSAGSLASSVYVAPGGTLGGDYEVNPSGGGIISGPLVTVAGNLWPGCGGVLNPQANILGILHNLTFAPGGIATFDLTNSYNQFNNEVVVNGALTINNNVIHLRAFSASANLDTTGDYVLIDNSGGSGITGSFLSSPVWDVRPLNYANFLVKNNGSGQIVLRYSSIVPPSAGVTVNPATVSRNQNALVTVLETNGTVSIASVTLDASSIGGSSSVPLVLASAHGSYNVYTNSVAATASTVPGIYSLTATITDTAPVPNVINVGASLNVTVANSVWTGASTSDSFWDTNPNWVNSAAPGYVGDNVIFAGTTRLAPSMDYSYNLNNLTFSNNAGSFNIGTANSSVLTVSGGNVVNNSANPQTLNVPILFVTNAATINAAGGNLTLGQTVDNGGNLLTVTDGGHNTTFANAVSGAGGFSMSGTGTATLSVADTFTGAIAVNSTGTLNLDDNNTSAATIAVNQGTLNVVGAGAIASASVINVNDVTGSKAVLEVSGGSVSANNNAGQFNPSLYLGTSAGGLGDLFVSSGSVAAASELNTGNGSGSYGAITVTGGSVSSGSYLVVGLNNDRGVINQSGGAITVGTGVGHVMTIAAGGTGSIGVVNLSGGTFTATSGNDGGVFVGERGVGILNVFGSAAVSLTTVNSLNIGPIVSQTGWNGTVNLLGGTVTAIKVSKGLGTGTATLNFNGGTLVAGSGAATPFITGLDNSYVYSGGAIIDDGGAAVTIAQPLTAPAGYGVSSIAVTNGGSGYIDTPIVTLTGGSGVGATAIAQINYATGVVTNLVVTSPGSGYASSDVLTVNFLGGGGSGAGANTPVLSASVGGGLTKLNTGTLTLTGGNSYTGNTTISNGTLALGTGGSIGSSANINVTGGATLDVSAINFTLNSGQILKGNGTVNGTVTNNGTIAPGPSGSIGTLTFNNNLTLKAGGVTSFKLNESLAPAATNDQLIVSGAVNQAGTLAINNLGGALHVNDTFQLISAGSLTGSFAGISGSPGAGLAYSYNSTSGVLSVVTGLPSNPTNITFSVSGNTLTLNWPLSYQGWLLQSNSIDLANTNDWFLVPGSASTTQEIITMNPAKTNVFYRMKHP
jgi:autotransporter-associated beta strand protein